MPSPEELQAEADAIEWYHSIDLGRGVRTRGKSVNALTPDQLVDFAGRSVLDIGAWDGYYSFLAEQTGAASVVALDHYAWGVDFDARGAYWNECMRDGTLPDQRRDTTDFWRDDLPGQAGFRFAKRVLGSNVEPVVGDFMTVDLAALGRFDVVLYLGVLYHVPEPFTALQRIREITGEVAVVETEAVAIGGLEHAAMTSFTAGSEVHTDFGVWYVPSEAALRSMCRAAGFRSVDTVVGPPVLPAPSAEDPMIHTRHYRALLRAWV